MLGHRTKWLLCRSLMLIALPPAAAAASETVIELRQAGWTVVERQERIERRPGLPPYRTMDRTVQVTTFVLEKAGRRKRCTLTYDSQRDSIAETCATPSDAPVTGPR